jgi:hypothetical protein
MLMPTKRSLLNQSKTVLSHWWVPLVLKKAEMDKLKNKRLNKSADLVKTYNKNKILQLKSNLIQSNHSLK